MGRPLVQLVPRTVIPGTRLWRPRLFRFAAVGFAVVLASLVGQTGGLAQEAGASADAAADQQVERLIGDLGDASYEVRSRATRELCMIGQRAGAALRRAATGDEFEIALRAKNLLEVIESLYFGGCRLALSADKTRIAWDEPVELVVAIRNESTYRAQVPFEPLGPGRERLPPQARQVGDMIDLAEHLRVRSPDGQEVNLRIDDIRNDPWVAEAVDWRADGGPLAELSPDQQIVVRIAGFNRGWARYPLLSRGLYKVQLVYEPEWDDQEFRRAGVGRVSSNVLEIEVAKEAPPIIRRAHRPAQVTVERQGPELVAYLTNTDDLPVWVNLNLASPQPPFAELRWTIRAGDSFEDLNLNTKGPHTLDAFRRERLVELTSGSRIELARAPIARLLEAAPAREQDRNQQLEVRATWTNLTSTAWQRSQRPSLLNSPRTPAALRTLLPPRMLTGRHTSQPIRLPNGHE